MNKSEIKIAKNNYKYLRIKKGNFTFCIFETEKYLIEHIKYKVNSWMMENEIFDNRLNIDPSLLLLKDCLNEKNYHIYLNAFNNKLKIKEEYDLYEEMNDPYVCSMRHEKPSIISFFCDEELEM